MPFTQLRNRDEIVLSRPGLVRLNPDVVRALNAIRQTGGVPFLVGGCVRDAVINPDSAPKDIDVEVYWQPDIDVIIRALSYTGQVSEVGRSFGVLKLRAGDTDLDISLPRRDSRVGAGHRGFSVLTDPGLSLREAAGRRDFTINSLSWDPATGELHDCWSGLTDIEAGVLRHVTTAFTEDPLRVLRGVQFAARFGYALAPETATCCRQLSGSYAELPRERVWGELAKLGAKGRSISAGLHTLWDAGWERHFPQLAALEGTRQDPEWHPEGDALTHTGLTGDQAARLADEAGLTEDNRMVVVLGALAHDLGKPEHTQIMVSDDGTTRITSHGHAEGGVQPAREFLRNAGCPEGIIMRILPLVREHMVCVGSQPTPSAVRRLARRLGQATLEEWALVCHADHAGRDDPKASSPASKWLETARQLRVSERPGNGILTGHHLIRTGLRPGPVFGEILRDALVAQDDGQFADETGALSWLGEYLDHRSQPYYHAPSR